MHKSSSMVSKFQCTTQIKNTRDEKGKNTALVFVVSQLGFGTNPPASECRLLRIRFVFVCVLDVDENHLIFEHSHINKPMFLKITKSIYTSIWITSSNCYCSGLYLYITWCVECVPNLFVNNSHFCRFHCDISMLLLSFATLFLLIEYAWLRELILLAIFLALFLVLEFNLTRSRFFFFSSLCHCLRVCVFIPNGS